MTRMTPMATKTIKTTEELQELLDSSYDRPLFILKHSTRCPISTDALSELQSFSAESSLECYIILVVENRDISNALAEALKVKHESPQVFLVQNGQAFWHTSHGSISAPGMRRAQDIVLSGEGTQAK